MIRCVSAPKLADRLSSPWGGAWYTGPTTAGAAAGGGADGKVICAMAVGDMSVAIRNAAIWARSFMDQAIAQSGVEVNAFAP